MNKLSRVVLLAALVAGCKSKAKEPAPGATAGSGAPAQSTAWLERLPQVEGSDAKLLLNRAAGLVEIKADGSIHVAQPPATRPADPRKPTADPLAGAAKVQLAELTQKLNLPAVAPRRENALSAEASDAAGEGAAIDAFALLGHPAPASGAPAPTKRATSAFGVVHEHDVSAGVIVFADAKAPAGVLVDVLAQTGGFIAVRRGNELGALPLAFDRQTPAPISPVVSWVEARLGPAIEVERVPSNPTSVASLDKLGEAVTPMATKAVDVLVAPDTTVQDLMAAVGRLRDAKVMALGFGRVPGGDAAAGRGDQGARVIAWGFELLERGATDAAAVRAAFDSTLAPIRTCYTQALAATPDLAGTAQLQLSVAPSGVAGADITGGSAPLVKCVSAAIKAAAFPRSSGGTRAVATLAFLPR